MTTKKLFVLVSIFLLTFSLFLSGCGNKVTEDVVKEKETIKIGVILPLTGGAAFLGEGMRDGILLAKDQLKDTKYNYEVIFEDNKLDNKETVTAANKLINIDKVEAIFTATSGPGNVVTPIAQENKIIHIGLASDPNVAKGEYNFIHWTPPEEEGKVFVEELQKREIKKIAILALNQQGIQAILDGVKEKAKDTDIKIISEELFNFGDADFKTMISKAKKENPEIYLILAFSPELELIAKQMKELNIENPSTSIEAFEFTEQPELFEGMWYVQAAESTPKFRKQFKEKYGKEPVICTPNSYDQFNLLATAFEVAGKDSSKKPTNSEVIKELQRIKDFDGSLGKLTVLENGFIHSKAVVREIRDGKFITIDQSTSQKESEETLKIGVITPLTGPGSEYGTATQKNLELALEKINQQGGINGKKVELIYEDSKCEPRTGVSALKKLTSIDKTNLIIGTVCSSVTLALTPIVEEQNLLIISSGSSNPKISQYPNTFRTWPSDALQGEFLAKSVAEDLKLKKAAIIFINNDYGVGLKDAFKEGFEQLGGEITAIEVIPEAATDTKTQLTKIKATNPEGVFLASYAKEAGLILKQAKELDFSTQFFGSEGVKDTSIFEISKGGSEELLFSVPETGSSEKRENYLNEFRERYNEYPGITGDSAYDILFLLKEIDCNDFSDTDCLKKGLLNLENFQGVTGNINFDENGDLIGKTYKLMQVKNSEFVDYEIN